MIIFNNLGHTFKPADDVLPIVWVDSQDATSYTLSGSDVLTLFNKGTLGGVMTLNGTVKFANSGFESWSISDYISYRVFDDLIGVSNFTIAITFDYNSTSGTHWFMDYLKGSSNRVTVETSNTNVGVNFKGNNTNSLNYASNAQGLNTILISYDFNSLTYSTIDKFGNVITNNSVMVNTQSYEDIQLLKYFFGNINAGADNPLHEFRLYDKAFSLTEMQDLQTELNNKYTP